MYVEKLHSLTVANSKFINDIGLVLMKELQYLTDEEHGLVLKLLLTRIPTETEAATDCRPHRRRGKERGRGKKQRLIHTF